jgi:hypothetical protein
MKRYMLIPFRASEIGTADKARYNVAVSKTRVIIENVIGILKGMWT